MRPQLPKPLTRGLKVVVKPFNALRNYVRASRVIMPAPGWHQTPEGVVPPVSTLDNVTRSLRPTLDGTKVRVSSGLVDVYVPEIGGVLLDADTPPTLSLSGAVFPWYVWIVIEWVPGSYETGGSPNYVAHNGTLQSPVVIAGGSALPDNVTPAVDSADGSPTTNGKYHFLIAKVTEHTTTGNLSLETERSGNRSIVICGEQDIKVIWDSP